MVEKLERYRVMYDGERQQREEMAEMGKMVKERVTQMEERKEQLEKELRASEREMDMLSCELQARARDAFELRE